MAATASIATGLDLDVHPASHRVPTGSLEMTPEQKKKCEELIIEALKGNTDAVIQSLRLEKVPVCSTVKLRVDESKNIHLNLLSAAILGRQPSLVSFLVKECNTFDKDCGLDESIFRGYQYDIGMGNRRSISPESMIFYAMLLSNSKNFGLVCNDLKKYGITPPGY